MCYSGTIKQTQNFVIHIVVIIGKQYQREANPLGIDVVAEHIIAYKTKQTAIWSYAYENMSVNVLFVKIKHYWDCNGIGM